MYKALVRSHFDYCDILYHIPALQTQLGVSLTDLMEKAERIQYQAALAITGAWQGSSRSKLYEELGWESLSERRWCRRILQIHKIVSNKMPSYLKNKLPRHRRPLYIVYINQYDIPRNTNLFCKIMQPSAKPCRVFSCFFLFFSFFSLFFSCFSCLHQTNLRSPSYVMIMPVQDLLLSA